MQVTLNDLLTNDAPGFDKYAIAAEFPGYDKQLLKPHDQRTVYQPEPGMPATMHVGSDSYPGYVQRTSTARNGSPTSVYVAKLFWDSDSKCWAPDASAVRKYTLRKDGRYRESGTSPRGGSSLTLGRAQQRQDPHF